MQLLTRQTKVVATVSPSSSRETIAGMIKAGMNVACLNFSHGSYDKLAQTIAQIRSIAEQLETPVTLLQELQSSELPSLSNKDIQDLEFGLSQEVDYIALSFIKSAEDVRVLKKLLQQKGASDTAVVAKIEKTDAIAHLEEILNECDAAMIAPSDFGVGMSQEKLPLLQKRIIGLCNHKGIPVISAIQIPENSIHNHSTRTEISDIANAITDGTDAVMLSGESEVNEASVEDVQRLVKIATETEAEIEFLNNPPAKTDLTHALSVGLNAICKVLPLRCIATFTSSGYTARLAAGERPKVPIIALTPNPKVYRSLNLIWGVQPVLLNREVETFEELTAQVEEILSDRSWVEPGDKILILAGIPTKHSQGTNFLKIHTIAANHGE
jgi:pyruvate kinase